MPHPSAALIILPGLDGTGMRLGAFIERIGSEFDTQLIGFPVDTALDYAQLEAWVRARLPVGRPFALLAESFSGPLAVRIGAAPPAGLTAVILCGSFVRSPYPRSPSPPHCSRACRSGRCRAGCASCCCGTPETGLRRRRRASAPARGCCPG